MDPTVLAAYAEARDQGIRAMLSVADGIAQLEAMELAGQPDLAKARKQTDAWIAGVRVALEEFENAIRPIRQAGH